MRFTLLFVLVIVLLVTAGCSGMYTDSNSLPEQAKSGLGNVSDGQKPLVWLMVVSIVSVALGGIALMNGSKSAIAVIAAGLISLALTVMILKFAMWIAIGSLIAGFGWLVYSGFIPKGFFNFHD